MRARAGMLQQLEEAQGATVCTVCTRYEAQVRRSAGRVARTAPACLVAAPLPVAVARPPGPPARCSRLPGGPRLSCCPEPLPLLLRPAGLATDRRRPLS